LNGSHYAQSDFLTYFTNAGHNRLIEDYWTVALGGHPAPITVWEWISDRFVSVTNTLVPMRLFFLSAHDESINALHHSCPYLCAGRSPGVVHFFFQYWTTLPFGAGILFYALLLTSLWRAARLWTWPVLVVVVLPFAAFALYWGDASTGLLREGLQAWVLTLLIVVALEQKRSRFAWLRSSPIRVLLSLRAVEVFLVAVLPTLVTRHRIYDSRFQVTDLVAVGAMTALCIYLGGLIWREHGRHPDYENTTNQAQRGQGLTRPVRLDRGGL
jgi:hypothetical protein